MLSGSARTKKAVSGPEGTSRDLELRGLGCLGLGLRWLPGASARRQQAGSPRREPQRSGNERGPATALGNGHSPAHLSRRDIARPTQPSARVIELGHSQDVGGRPMPVGGWRTAGPGATPEARGEGMTRKSTRTTARQILTFQELILRLTQYWADRGCLIAQPYDLEVGAGTFHPLTFFKALGTQPWRVAFVQPCRRPTDGRYAENPMRAQRYYQYQVLLKPAPDDVQQRYLNSLVALGIDLKAHDVRFVQDDWESPTLGAWGLGWEVWLDGLEVTQFTYFQQIGGVDLNPISAEITYGLERIAMFLQGRLDLYALQWDATHTYGDVHKQEEIEGSTYNFEHADTTLQRRYFEEARAEAERLLAADPPILLPAYEQLLKMSHAFNLLDARGAVSVNERPTLIAGVRGLAKRCAEQSVARGTRGA